MLENRSQHLCAKDLADRLMPGHTVSEFLAWPPNLFAYTSYILALTGAYQLVISPPTSFQWLPEDKDIKEWLDPKESATNIERWFTDLLSYLKGLAPDDAGDAGLPLNIGTWCKEKVQEKRVNESFKDRLQRLETNWNDNLDRSTTTFKPWREIVSEIARDWNKNIFSLSEDQFELLCSELTGHDQKRVFDILNIVIKFAPWELLACWAYFYKHTFINMGQWWRRNKTSDPTDGEFLPISYLLCNQPLSSKRFNIEKLWKVTQSLLTLHAISDEACIGWGIIGPVKKEKAKGKKPHPLFNASPFALRRLLDYGTMATFDPERCHVLPKRHNPNLGITLRSLSSNLAFHRTSVDVVWRHSSNNPLSERLRYDAPIDKQNKSMLSILLLPLPLVTRTSDFSESTRHEQRVQLVDGHRFFSYEPSEDLTRQRIERIIENANETLGSGSDRSVDIVVLPESSFDSGHEGSLLTAFAEMGNDRPSIFVAGLYGEGDNEKKAKKVAKKQNDKTGEIVKPRFSQNSVICRYYDSEDHEKADSLAYGDEEEENRQFERGIIPKHIQFKHHRWRLDRSQIRSYGLSQVLDPDSNYWEAVRVPKRRVSFLNVGDRMTMCHLICEDLARQDPIADLIRHVGPSLVITILLDGPQRIDRWPSKYASVLSEDPGSSVITLTNMGMVRRWSSPYRPMSRAVALWSEKNTPPREIELPQGAEGIILNIHIELESEITADGRVESKGNQTSVYRLVDIIPVFDDDNMKRERNKYES